MKRLCVLIGIFVLFTIFLTGIISLSPAFAEDNDNLLFAAESNSIWVLDKTTRKLIFIQFKKPDTVWKTKTVTVPSKFNLAKTKIKAVGSRGTSVFLYDKSQGFITFYQAIKDHSIKTFLVVSATEDLK